MKKYKTILEFLNDLDSEKRAQVEELRKLILGLGLDIEENIKWNAPNYSYKGADRITFNLMNKEAKVKLIIHMGASRKEDKNQPPILKEESQLIGWNSDIRGTISFDGLEDINNKQQHLQNILTRWLKLEV